MISVLWVVAILAVVAVITLLGWMSIRVPDPKHAMMLDLVSRMETDESNELEDSRAARTKLAR